MNPANTLIDGSEISLLKFLRALPGVDQVGAESRAAALATRSIKSSAKVWAGRERDVEFQV